MQLIEMARNYLNYFQILFFSEVRVQREAEALLCYNFGNIKR